MGEVADRKKLTPAVAKRFYPALVELMKRRALKDLYFLVKYVLGADRLKLGRSKFDEEHHKALCDDLMRHWARRQHGEKKCYVVRWPRGTMKSTIATVAFPIWVLLNDPDTRILIDSETATNAGLYLKSIKGYFESPLFIEIFGTLFDKRKGWNEESLTISRPGQGIKEPSVDIGGVEKEKTGRHYDLILPDDIVGKTNSRTIDQIKKSIEHFGLYIPLLDPEGCMVASMTPWAFNDLSEWIDEQNDLAISEVRTAPFQVNHKPAFKTIVSADGKQVSYSDEIEFKQLHTRDNLLHALNLLKPYQFSCQYLLHPQSPSEAPFKREWIKYIGEHCPDIPLGQSPEGSNVYISVDPAMSQKEGSDYTAIVVAAIKPDFSIYVLDVNRGRYTRKEIYDKLVELNALYKPNQIGIEAVFKMKEVLLYIKMQAQLNGVGLPLKTFTTSTQNKGNRIMGLQPIAQMGKFYIRRRQGDFIYLEDQMLKFDPKRIHAQENDCLDSAAYLIEMMNAQPEKKDGVFYDDPNWLQKLEDRNKLAVSKGLVPEPVPSLGLVRAQRWAAQKATVNRKDDWVPMSRFAR